MLQHASPSRVTKVALGPFSCVCGPRVHVVPAACSWAVVLLLHGAFLAVEAPLLLQEAGALPVVGAALLLVAVASLLGYTGLADPGIVPRRPIPADVMAAVDAVRKGAVDGASAASHSTAAAATPSVPDTDHADASDESDALLASQPGASAHPALDTAARSSDAGAYPMPAGAARGGMGGTPRSRAGGRAQGQLALQWPPSVRLADGTVMLRCDVCDVYKQLGSRHCRDCNHCVEGADHHCMWVGNCIGRKNLWHFNTLQGAVSAAALWLAGWSVAHIIFEGARHSGVDSSDWFDANHELLVALGGGILLTAIGFISRANLCLMIRAVGVAVFVAVAAVLTAPLGWRSVVSMFVASVALPVGVLELGVYLALVSDSCSSKRRARSSPPPPSAASRDATRR